VRKTVTKKQDGLADVDEVDGPSDDQMLKTAVHRPRALVKWLRNSVLTSMIVKISVHRVKRLVDDGHPGRRRKQLKRKQAKEVRNDHAVAERVQLTNPNHLVGEVVVREETVVAKLLRSSGIFPVGRRRLRRWRLSLLGPITPYAVVHAAGAPVVDARDS
jgi:hypothetical protein